MLTELRLQNYRGFENFLIQGLCPLTIITGPNGTGKTTILEAALLFAAEGNPGPLVNLQNHRGVDRIPKNSLSPLTRALFSHYTDTGEACISGEKDGRERNELKIRSTQSTMFGSTSNLADEAEQTSITFEWNGQLAGTLRFSNGDALEAVANRVLSANGMLLHPSIVGRAVDESARFASLLESNKKPLLLRALQIFNASISDIEYVPATAPYFGVSIVGESSLVPLGSLGGGINRAFQIALALVFCQNGLLCIDEFESGLYPSSATKLSEFLMRTAVELKTQLLITTHSEEIIEDFLNAHYYESESPVSRTSIAVLQLRRDSSGVQPFLQSGPQLKTAYESRLDLR